MTSNGKHISTFAPFRTLGWQTNAACITAGTNERSQTLGTLSLCPVRTAAQTSFAACESVWSLILEFVPWRAILKLRHVSRIVFQQSLSFVFVGYMRCTNLRSLFIACREDLDCPASVTADSQQETKTPGKPEPGHHRVFLGQLRRTGTVRMVEWLVYYVLEAPRGALVKIENHRNANTGRGKGCAWPTIADDATVNRLLLAHHRIFYDSVGGIEGVWFVPRDKADALTAETDRYNQMYDHVSHMPRSAIVAEAPRGAATAPVRRQTNTTPAKQRSMPTASVSTSHDRVHSPRNKLRASQPCASLIGMKARLSLPNLHKSFPPPAHPTLQRLSALPAHFSPKQNSRCVINPQQSMSNVHIHHVLCCTSNTFMGESSRSPGSAALESESSTSGGASSSSFEKAGTSVVSTRSYRVLLKDGSWRHNPYQM